jgi:peptidoglycan/LPS O-acetylase OafA/YrhL
MNQDRKAGLKAVPWRDNSSFVATFYAILTAMVGAILALAIGDPKIEKNWYWPVGLLALSMVSFIWGLEKCGEAMDEDDVDKYLAWLLAYNLGSVAMFFGLAAYIGLHHWPAVNQPNNKAGLPLLIALLAAAIVASWKWWEDIGFLLFANQVKYEAYREELLGDRKPETELDLLMRLHGFFRRFHNKKEERKSHA